MGPLSVSGLSPDGSLISSFTFKTLPFGVDQNTLELIV